MSPRSFIIGFGSLTVVLGLAYIASFNLMLGAPITAEYWLRGVTHIKLTLAGKADEPKILFVGGSSTLFSIDTARISKSVGKPVFNMGLHAGLPLQYHIDFAKRVALPGDTIILIPEYGYYRRDDTNTSWFINQILSWDGDYYRGLDFLDKIKFVSEVPLKQIYNAVLANALEKKITTKIPYRMKVSDEKVMSVFTAGWNSTRNANFPERRVFQYYYNNINDHGDINNTVGSDLPKSGGYGMIDRLAYSKGSWRSISDFKKYCDDNGLKLLMGFAPIVSGGVVSKNIEIINENMEGIISMAREQGIPFIDEPSAMLFDAKFFFDTDSHLNIEGKRIRSDYLVDRLMRFQPR